MKNFIHVIISKNSLNDNNSIGYQKKNSIYYIIFIFEKSIYYINYHSIRYKKKLKAI